jgi:hypothetical protein
MVLMMTLSEDTTYARQAAWMSAIAHNFCWGGNAVEFTETDRTILIIVVLLLLVTVIVHRSICVDNCAVYFVENQEFHLVFDDFVTSELILHFFSFVC